MNSLPLFRQHKLKGINEEGPENIGSGLESARFSFYLNAAVVLCEPINFALSFYDCKYGMDISRYCKHTFPRITGNPLELLFLYQLLNIQMSVWTAGIRPGTEHMNKRQLKVRGTNSWPGR